VEQFRLESGIELIIPDASTIDYKEAIIFAFLGFLRSINKINCYASVTGAIRDTSCGILYLP
jgi:anhydro-N-acetylmuramic acid kinase